MFTPGEGNTSRLFENSTRDPPAALLSPGRREATIKTIGDQLRRLRGCPIALNNKHWRYTMTTEDKIIDAEEMIAFCTKMINASANGARGLRAARINGFKTERAEARKDLAALLAK